jgi:ribosome biogenesis protein BRX1
MSDFETLLPHPQKHQKYGNPSYVLLNDIAEEKECSSIMLFETRHTDDHFLWAAVPPGGPSVCFRIKNMHSIEELHLIGKCSKHSRVLLFFDPTFETGPHFGIVKEILRRAFQIPYSEQYQFVDVAITVSIADGHIWVSRYQVMWEEGELRMFEAGPRFCLQIAFILGGSFCGSKIYSNPDFVKKGKHKSGEKAPDE